MTRHDGKALGLVWLLGTLFAASTALAERPKCPPGERPGIRGCVSAAPRARALPSAKETQRDRPPAAKPAVERDAEPRALRSADKRLLLSELQRLEQLLRVTRKDSPDRPALLRRLAEGYAELERLALLERETAKLRAERAEQERAEKSRGRATF